MQCSTMQLLGGHRGRDRLPQCRRRLSDLCVKTMPNHALQTTICVPLCEQIQAPPFPIASRIVSRLIHHSTMPGIRPLPTSNPLPNLNNPPPARVRTLNNWKRSSSPFVTKWQRYVLPKSLGLSFVDNNLVASKRSLRGTEHPQRGLASKTS